MTSFSFFYRKMPIILLWVIGISISATHAEDFGTKESAEKMPLASRSLVLSMADTGKSLVAVGERGHVLLSGDCGGKWKQVIVPTRALLTSVYFTDQQHGWAVGHDSVILRTQDGGHSWEKVYQDIKLEKPLLDVWFENNRYGFAVGAYGIFLETSDGGKHWNQRNIIPDDFHLYSISVIPGIAWFVTGESGSVYRSMDKGKSWARLSLPYEGTFFGSVVAYDNRLLVFGMRGHAFSSDDLGESWKKIDTGIASAIEAGLRLPGHKLLLAGHDGVLLQSDNNGKTFSLSRLPGRQHFSSLILCHSRRLVGGERGVQEVKP